jgi:nuclear GTP-binding protein
LVPKEVLDKWLKYLRNFFPTIPFKASTQTQRGNLKQSTVSVDSAPANLLNSGECLGAEALIQLLKNYCRNADIKTAIKVGVIGYPNVGKSSLINSLKRARVCGVGSTPGLTKSLQEVHIDKHIKLIDCPGIVFSKDSHASPQVILRNCVKVETLPNPVAPGEFIPFQLNPNVYLHSFPS